MAKGHSGLCQVRERVQPSLSPPSAMEGSCNARDDQDASLGSAVATQGDPTATSDAHEQQEEKRSHVLLEESVAKSPVDREMEAPTPGSTTHCQNGELDVLGDLDDSASVHGDADPAEELQSQLEREMAKRRPDRFMIGVICRALGGVPDKFRSTIWKELLGVARSERLHLDQSILQVEEDLANQKVIAADACRTRGNDEHFRQQTTVETIVKILTFYSKSRNIRYKQGMNEVLAPFLMLEKNPPMPEGVVFQLFYAMIDKFLPHVFVDRDFKSLQCSFQLFRLLMLYHDPMLCNYLDQHAMTPELYVTPWFMTLFARGLPQELVFALWDFFILNEDPYLLHYVAYALVESYRETILSADVSMLPQVLSSISIDSRERLDAVCAAALQLMDTTPRSYKRDLYSVCYGGYNDAMVPFLRQLMGASSMQVYPDELLSNLLSRLDQAAGASPAAVPAMPPSAPLTTAELIAQKSYSAERTASMSSVFFIVLDCRPIEQYRECHLSLSYHIDPDIVGSPDALSVLIKGFTRMKGCHFCFVGPTVPPSPVAKSSGGAFEAITRLTRGMSGDRQQLEAALSASTGSNSSLLGVGTNTVPFLKKEHITVTRLVLMFLQKGFEHVSRLDGGFEELKLEIEKLDQFSQEQLLVHEDSPSPDLTIVASSSEKAAGGLKSFAKKAFERVRTLSEDDPFSAIVQDTSSNGGSSVKAKPKITVSTISQRLQIFTTAAKDAVGASSVKPLQSPPPQSEMAVTDERRLVGKEEWIEVCARTREALEKSLSFKDVVFQAGSLGILFQRSRHKNYHTVVDSLVPESQASESQQVEPGDLLIAVNGQDITGIPFPEVIEMIKDAARPLVLRLQNPKKKSLDTFDAISIPPLPPIMISASHHSLCISWNKLSIPNARYQLQFAKQSDYNFNPWMSVPIKHESNAGEIDRTTGITTHHNGTLVGLDPGVSLVFRVRCGNGEKWGPYSLSSGHMCTLEKGLDANDGSVVNSPTSVRNPSAAVFLPGECPEFFEKGVFYFRVAIGLRARATPAYEAEKLDVILEKGTIIKCSERLVAPGTNQIFVRLCPDWNVAARKPASKQDKDGAEQHSNSEDPDGFEAWAFENTPEGACVLERLPEFSEDMITPAVPLQEQAKSLVSSIFSGGGIKAPTSTTGSSSSSSAPASVSSFSPASPVEAPRIVKVAPLSSSEIELTWVRMDDPNVTRYQIQFAKNRLTAAWSTLKNEVMSDTTTFTASDLAPNTSYVFRVRAGYDDQRWGPYSETSSPCKTAEEVVSLKTEVPEVLVSEATTPKMGPPLRDESDLVATAAANATSERSSPFTSLFIRGTHTSSATNGLPTSQSRSAPQPLRTGSTLLDKAVAAASKLSLSRSDSGLRRRRSSAAAPPPTPEERLEGVLPAEGDLIDVAAWKIDLEAIDTTSKYFHSVRYIPTVVVTSEPSRTPHEIDPFAAIATSKPLSTIDSGSSGSVESSPGQLTWNRVGERELIVTKTALLVLAKPSSNKEAPDAVVETRRSLSVLAKITSKKTVPNSVVFHFRRELTEIERLTHTSNESTDEDDVPLEQVCFVVDDKTACVALVRQNYSPEEPTV